MQDFEKSKVITISVDKECREDLQFIVDYFKTNYSGLDIPLSHLVKKGFNLFRKSIETKIRNGKVKTFIRG